MKNSHIDLMGVGMRSILHFVRVLAVMLLMGFNAGVVRAQPYPSRHIELVSPTGAGGGSDLVARTVAEIVARENYCHSRSSCRTAPVAAALWGKCMWRASAATHTCLFRRWRG